MGSREQRAAAHSWQPSALIKMQNGREGHRLLGLETRAAHQGVEGGSCADSVPNSVAVGSGPSACILACLKKVLWVF